MLRTVYRIAQLTVLATALSAFAVALPGHDGGKPQDNAEAKKPAQPARARGAMEVRFIDDSILKLTVCDPEIELQTPYGKLVIPVGDIHRIDLGLRISEEDAKRIDAQTAKLGSQQFREREEASTELLALGHKSYPALLRAVKSSDPEVVRRAEHLLDKLRETVPADILEMPAHDVVLTQHSKIAGKIGATALRVTTFQFGDLQLKLADVRSLRSLDAPDAEVAANGVLPDPGSLVSYQAQIGKTFRFRVTGTVAGSVWGTGVYTADSTLALAAVHAGVLKPGQTAVVRVKVVASPPAFQGSTQNGVTSAGYGPYQAAYRVSR